jgi:CRP-like cAMP-binding protein
MASSSTTNETLANISMFSELSAKELKGILKLMTPVRLKEGKVITKEGDPGREFMIIVEGKATVRRKGSVLAQLGPGDFFGEMAVVAGVPRTATVTADTDMVVEALNRREFSSLLDESPKLAKKILVGAVKRLHEIEESVAR